MTHDELRAVNELQEPPPATTLTGLPRDLYYKTKQNIAEWEPAPMPEKEE